MLLKGSITLQLVLLVSAQNYDPEYRPDYEGDENSSYNENTDGPDYSKYYSSDSEALPPITAKSGEGDSGFVSPLDFSGFFGPSQFEFGAASNQEATKAKQGNGFVSPHELASGFPSFQAQTGFGGRDYFEQAAQKQQQPEKETDYELKPGPSYVSHKIVPPTQQKISEISDLNKNYNHNNKYNPYKTVKTNSDDDDDNVKFEEQQKQVPKYDFTIYDAVYPQSAKPTAVDPKYLPQQYIPKNPQTVTPYQKYSFQPGAAGNDFTSYTPALQNFKYTTTLPNYEYAPSEYVSKLIQHKNCQKVNKDKLGEGKTMDCYVCKNPKTGANYEECSYGAESKPKAFYVESSKKYSTPGNIHSYRYKRYTVSDENEKDDDPYENIKSQSKKYYAKPKDFEESYYQPYDYDKEAYRFPTEYFEGEDKSASEQQSEQLVKSGENCKKIHTKDNMVCMVCKSKSGGSYEQCSYSSAPNEKKYAYVKEKKYDSNDEPEEEETEGTEEKPIKDKQYRKGEKGHTVDDIERIKPKSTNRPRPSESARNDKIEYDVPKHFEEHNSRHQGEEKPLESSNKDSYYYKYFPEYTKQESKQNEQNAEPDTENYGYYGEGDKKDVEEVLAEFAQKDRSQCKKAEKNGMTCYLCTDKKGQQHEECMYVSESRPQSKYQAYHAQAETEEPEKQQSKIKPTEVPTPKPKPKQRRFPKKSESLKIHSSPAPFATTTQPTLQSTLQTASTKTKRQYRRTKNIPTTEPPQKTYSEDGEYADETKPVYSKVLGFSLPKYMLTRSESERNYDQFVTGKS